MFGQDCEPTTCFGTTESHRTVLLVVVIPLHNVAQGQDDGSTIDNMLRKTHEYEAGSLNLAVYILVVEAHQVVWSKDYDE